MRQEAEAAKPSTWFLLRLRLDDGRAPTVFLCLSVRLSVHPMKSANNPKSNFSFEFFGGKKTTKRLVRKLQSRAAMTSGCNILDRQLKCYCRCAQEATLCRIHYYILLNSREEE